MNDESKNQNPETPMISIISSQAATPDTKNAPENVGISNAPVNKQSENKEKNQKQRVILSFLTFFLLVIIGLSVYFLFLMNRKEKPDTGTTNYNTLFGKLFYPLNEEYLDFSGNMYSDSLLNLPTTTDIYPVFQADTEDSLVADFSKAEKIATQIGADVFSDYDDVSVWESESVSLTFNKISNSINIKFLNINTESELTLPANDEAFEIAIGKLKEFNLWPYVDPSTYQITTSYIRFSGYEGVRTNDPFKADLIQINFSSLINNTPIINSSFLNGEINVIINKEKNIYSINYSYIPIIVENEGTYPLISPSYASTLIKQGRGELNLPTVSSESPKIVVNKYSFGYKLDPSYQYFQPIYIFEGDLDSSGEKAYILIPMVDSNYLISGNTPTE